MGDGDDKIPDVAGLSAVIPHFHYDLIGRIAPGMYLVLGAYWIVNPRCGFAPWKDTPSLTIVAAGFLAYVLGFLIGPLSNFLFDWLCRFKEKSTPAPVLEAMGRKTPTEETREKRWIKRITGHLKRWWKNEWQETLVSRSEQDVFKLWQRAPQLALMTSRWDAEAFAARQFGTATMILAALWLALTGRFEVLTPKFDLFIALAAGIVILCWLQFRYSRRRAVHTRIVMLASLLPETPATLPPDSPGANKAAEAGK